MSFWKELKENLKEKGSNWMLCLGAGVGISVGLPDWYGLLAKITAQTISIMGENTTDKESSFYKGVGNYYKEIAYNDAFLEKVEKSLDGEFKKTFESINVLEAAEYIRNYLADNLKNLDNDEEGDAGQDNDEKSADRNLRMRIDAYPNSAIQQACDIGIKIEPGNPKLEKKTLAAVARLMKSEHDQLIHTAITYNYDNLLEEYLRKICGCDPQKVHSIVKEDELRDFGDTEEWNIYHVHGRVPVPSCLEETISDSAILTETDYYQQEQINYS